MAQESVCAFLLAFREGSGHDSENYCWFNRHYNQFLYVDRIVVSKAHRGKQFGALLYADLFRFARAADPERITSEIDIEPANRVSLRFHERFGFEEVGSQWLAGAKKRLSLQAALL